MYVIETYLAKYIGDLIGDKNEQKRSFKRMIQILCISICCRVLLYIIDGNFLPYMEKLIRINIMERDLHFSTDVGVSLKDAMTIPEQIKIFFEIIRYSVIPTLFSEISTIILLYKISPRIAFISLIILIFVLVLCIFNVWGLNEWFSEQEILAGDAISKNHADVIRNRKNVIHYNQYDNELSHNNNLNIRYNSYYRGHFLFNYTSKTLIIGLSYFVLLYGIFISFKEFEKKKIKLKDITTVSLLLVRFVELNGRYIISIGEFAYLLKTLSMKECYCKLSFSFKGLKKNLALNLEQYRKTPIVFDDVLIKRGNFRLRIHNLTIDKQLTVISGISGSGKTTLISCLLRSITDYEGSITIFGHELNSFNFQTINGLIAYLPQQPILFNRNIFENIQYFDTSITREYILEVIRNLGVKNITENMLDRIVTPQNDNVSGGQMQIICMLRAIVRKKDIIIMDEPTSALDPLNTNYVIEMMQKIKNFCQLIVVSHDDRVIAISDHNIVLDKGKLIKN